MYDRMPKTGSKATGSQRSTVKKYLTKMYKTNYSTEKYWRHSSLISPDDAYLFDVYIDFDGNCASVFKLPDGTYRSIFYNGSADYNFEEVVDSKNIEELTNLLSFKGEIV